jgi:hypothetical protein
MYYAWKIDNRWPKRIMTFFAGKKRRKTRNDVGKGSGKTDESEEFNT